jgi:nucleolar complex protein 2
MGKKAAKSTRKFAASGQLKKTIQARKKHQEIRRKTQGKQKRRDTTKGKQATRADDDEGEEVEEEEFGSRKGKSR